MILNGLPWKQTEIILLFLSLHPSTAFRTLLLTMMATPFFSKYYTNIIKGPLRYAYLIFCSFLLHMFKNVDSNMTNIFNWKIGKRKHTYSKEAHTKIKIINILWDKNFLALKHFAFQHNIKFMKIITHPIENTVPLCIKGKEKKKT